MTRLSKFTVLVLLLLTLAIVRCGDNGDHAYIPPQDPCAGHPSPCFTEDWGVWAYTFWSEETWEWYDVYSDGEYAGLWWWVYVTDGPAARLVGGFVGDQCRTFTITDYAEIWWDPYAWEYYLVPYDGQASGGVEICADDLLISNLWIQGAEWGDITAEYEGKSELPLSVSAEKPGAFVEELPAIEGQKQERTE